MSMNQRLRQKMKQNGPEAVLKWEKERKENALKFNASKYEHAEKEVKKYRQQCETSLLYR